MASFGAQRVFLYPLGTFCGEVGSTEDLGGGNYL